VTRFARLGVLTAVALVLASTAGASRSTAFGTVVAWGCGNPAINGGQCDVPPGLTGVTAVAAGDRHSLAVTADGRVVAWGCRDPSERFRQCNVPPELSGVTAVAAATFTASR
jgi:hypothetical protein